MLSTPDNKIWTPRLDAEMPLMMMQSPALFAVLQSREGICVMINPAFSRLLRHHDVLHKPVSESWPQFRNFNLISSVEKVFETGKAVYDYEVQLEAVQDNGVMISGWYDFVYSPYSPNGGDVECVTIIGFEVTARVNARQQLAEQQLLLKNITDAAATALWMIDVNGDVTFVNQTWIDWTGRPAHAHVGRGWIESVVSTDREQVISRFVRGLNAKEQFEVDFRIRHKDGRLQWVAATGKPRYLSDGTFAGYVGSCMDITQRKESERLLRESEERFRRIADSAPVFIWMFDAEGSGTFFNKSWLQFTGQSFVQSVGKVIPDEVHEDDQEKLLRLFGESFAERIELYAEFRLKRYDNTYRWIGMKFAPRFTGNVFEGYIGSGMDITEAKEHEQLKNEFIGMASHELKTPITSIKGYVQLLINMYKDNTGEEFLHKSLATVDKQINKLTRLITDLLDISKIESGRLSLNTDDFLINDLVREIIEEVQHTTNRHDIVFNEQQTFTVCADRDRIAQVITNLLTNAVKYSPQNDRIDVYLTVDGSDVKITVRDYGIGIDLNDQQRVFNRFYRVEGRNEQTFSGFGIGLYVAAEIVRRHNGRIWVESEKGAGSAFSFTLPVC